MEVVYRSRSLWKEDETRVFLKSWKSHYYINRLIKKGCSRHPLYFAISKDLQKHGFNRTVNEIQFKKKNMERKYRNSKGIVDFKYYKEVEEIMKMDPGFVAKDSSAVESQVVQVADQPEIVLDKSYVEGISSENVQVIRLSVPDDQGVSESSPPLYTVISHSEPEVQNESRIFEVTMPQSSSSISKKPPENILLSFFQEFERSNRQLEKNDAAMLELFKEQNDIFRTQTTLLMKLLLK